MQKRKNEHRPSKVIMPYFYKMVSKLQLLEMVAIFQKILLISIFPYIKIKYVKIDHLKFRRNILLIAIKQKKLDTKLLHLSFLSPLKSD